MTTLVQVRPPAAPPAAPGLQVAPDVDGGSWLPGVLLAWRWTDETAGTWSGLVRYSRGNGLVYEHWLSHEVIWPASGSEAV